MYILFIISKSILILLLNTKLLINIIIFCFFLYKTLHDISNNELKLFKIRVFNKFFMVINFSYFFGYGVILYLLLSPIYILINLLLVS